MSKPGATRVTSARIACTLLVGLSLCGALPTLVRAAPADIDPPANDENPADLEKLFARLREIMGGKDWQKEGFREVQIDAWLTGLIERVRRVTGDPQLFDLPVRFADVVAEPQQDAAALPRPPGGGPLPGLVGKLIVSDSDVELAHATRCIVLVDGNARVSFANESVIVARGAVYVAHGRGNVIVAGHFIHVSHDGQSRPARNPAGGLARAPGGGMPLMEVVLPGSILVSGSTIDVSHAHGSICVAGDAVRISHANGCYFIVPPDSVQASHQNGCHEFLGTDVRPTIRRDPLADKVKVEMLLPRKGAVFRFDGRRYVADLGAEIKDEAGKPVEALAGWKLSFCDADYALFTKKTEDFGACVPREDEGG